MPTVQRENLSPDHESRLRVLSGIADEAVARRARLILRWHAGATQAEIADEVGLSISGVAHWLRQYRERGLTIFDGVPESAQQSAPQATPVEPIGEVMPEPIPEPVSEPEAAVAATPVEPPRRGRKPAAKPTPPEPPVRQAIPAIMPEAEQAPLPVIGLMGARSRNRNAAKPIDAVAVPDDVPAMVEPTPEPEPVQESRPVETPAPRRGRPPQTARNQNPQQQPTRTPPPKPQPTQPPKGQSRPAPTREVPPPVARTPVPEPPPPVPIAPPAPIVPAKPTQPKPTVRGLIEFYDADLKHAQHIAGLAGLLFDATAETHRLHDRTRRILEAGALLHNVAYGENAEQYAARGRDIVLKTPLEGFSPEERRMIAMLIAFHRDRVTPEREPAYLELPAELRADTLALAAILRLADGGDHSESQSTAIVEVLTEPDELAIGLGGPQASTDGLAILNKADLWERLFNQHVRVYLTEDAEDYMPTSQSLAVPPALRDQMPDISVTLNPSIDARNAYRQLALHYADRLDRLAARVRIGDQHKLAAFERELARLADVVALAGLTRFDHTLAWLGEKAHTARVAFAIVDRASALADDPDQAGSEAIAAGLNHWKFALRAAFEALDFARCDHLIGELRRELFAEQHDQPAAAVAGRIGMIVWERLAVLREAVELGESVHKALAAAYKLEDALLFFRSLLSPETTQALDMLTPFEGYLGAITLVQASLDSIDREHYADGSPEAQAVAAFRQAQSQTLDELADNLPNLWNVVNSPVFRRTLALALAQA